jgi:hypothetical protein
MVGLLTVCPPEYGPAVARIMALAFGGTELLAIMKLTFAVERTFSGVTKTAIAGILLAIFVLAMIAWGFLAPMR